VRADRVLIQRQWKLGEDGRWRWVGEGPQEEFPARPLVKRPQGRFEKPTSFPVREWNPQTQRYDESPERFKIVTINLGNRRQRETYSKLLRDAVEHLELWAQWSTELTEAAEKPELEGDRDRAGVLARQSPVYKELSLMARNIADDLKGTRGRVALAYFNGVLYGATTYQFATPEGLNAGPGLSELIDDLLGRRILSEDQLLLYASYSVAHPFTQAEPSQRGKGQIGGVGSALRKMREWHAAELGVATFTVTTNPRSYVQNLRSGFDDVGRPVENVFPAPDVVWK
jgi:hypothetical protein